MATLSLLHISKHFGSTPVVQDVGFEIRSGEFFSILGPSGCGKTTLLRMIAGFEKPSEGQIMIDGKDVTALAPQFRGVGMVFQNYALFPHMSVGENVTFGLRTAGIGKEPAGEKVKSILKTVGLADLIDRPVTLLSGGEQQRVAVARAIVVEPAVLLFDEPLSNLDPALRLRTREEIRSIQRSTGITTVYVTHDQSEAMSMSDRVAVLYRGRLEQVGNPRDAYERPATPFVAEFLGGASFLRGALDGASHTFTSNGIVFHAPAPPMGVHEGNVSIAVKPDCVLIGAAGSHSIDGEIKELEYLGFVTMAELDIAGQTVRAFLVDREAARGYSVGSRVPLTIDWARCTAFRED